MVERDHDFLQRGTYRQYDVCYNHGYLQINVEEKKTFRSRFEPTRAIGFEINTIYGSLIFSPILYAKQEISDPDSTLQQRTDQLDFETEVPKLISSIMFAEVHS